MTINDIQSAFIWISLLVHLEELEEEEHKFKKKNNPKDNTTLYKAVQFF